MRDEGASDLPGSARAAPTLGVVAIARNEEADIEAFFRNLLPWVDEVVLVDDGSTDRTVEIARAQGPKVEVICAPRNEGEYFSDLRNAGIAAARADWLLHMDIDERVPPGLAAEIRAATRSPERDAYRFRRLNYFLHRPMRGGGWQDWNLVHLARRDVLRFGGMFHESCEVLAPPERIGQLETRMIHLNEPSFAHRLAKSATYLEEAVERVSRRDRPVRSRDLVLRPALDFLYRYVYRRGFRDGTPGLIAALHSATAVFRAHAFVWDRQNAIPRQKIEAEIVRAWAERGDGPGS